MTEAATSSARLRFATLAFAIALTLVWICVGVWAAGQTTSRFDAAGLHVIGAFFIAPSVFFAAVGVWVRVALGLTSFAAFFYLSVLIAGQISN